MRDEAHSHCPFDCEHPQPFSGILLPEYAADFPNLTPGVEYEFCGRCWHVDHRLTVMVACTPETCPEAKRFGGWR